MKPKIDTSGIRYVGKDVRIKKGLTVRGLAAQADIAPSTITKWENQTACPELYLLAIVADAIEVNPWDLVEFNGKKYNE